MIHVEGGKTGCFELVRRLLAKLRLAVPQPSPELAFEPSLSCLVRNELRIVGGLEEIILVSVSTLIRIHQPSQVLA